MFKRRLRTALRSGGLGLACVLTVPASLLAAIGAEGVHAASIPFASHNGIRDWQADGTQGLWVQDNSRKWYYGRFSFPCIGLQFKAALRFKFSPDGGFDRWSEVSTPEAGRCLFKTFEENPGPPVAAKKQPAAAPAAPPAPGAAGS